MGKTVTVSFEGENVRIVYATLKKKGIVVDDALVLKDEQFDDFLEKEKTKEFIVVYDFKHFYQDIISIPPAKNRYVKNLVEAEIRKKASDFKEFSFIHFVYGEKIIENRRIKEIFVFAVRNEDLRDVINRFIHRGKVIKAIYPSVLTVAGLFKSIEEPFLCVSEIGQNKNLFLLRDGKIQFVRTVHSLAHGINDFDIQNINMTVNYCKQAMRTTPSFVMLTGSLCSYDDAAANISIPVVCLAPLFFRSQMSSALLDFIFPVSAFFITRDMNLDLLTREYKSFSQLTLLLKYSTFLFLSLSIIGIGYGGFIVKNIVESKNKLSSIRMHSRDGENTLSLYENKRAELSGYMPFITLLKNSTSIPDIQRFLSLLSGLTTDNIRIDSISLSVGEGSLKGELKGLIKSESYANMQMYYQKLINSISGINGFSIKGHRLELKDKTFHIEIEYR